MDINWFGKKQQQTYLLGLYYTGTFTPREEHLSFKLPLAVRMDPTRKHLN